MCQTVVSRRYLKQWSPSQRAPLPVQLKVWNCITMYYNLVGKNSRTTWNTISTSYGPQLELSHSCHHFLEEGLSTKHSILGPQVQKGVSRTLTSVRLKKTPTKSMVDIRPPPLQVRVGVRYKNWGSPAQRPWSPIRVWNHMFETQLKYDSGVKTQMLHNRWRTTS